MKNLTMKTPPYPVNTIAEQRKIGSQPHPPHPLVDVFRIEDVKYNPDVRFATLSLNLYCIAMKRNVEGKVRYGQGHYDYDGGLMSFMGPGQVVANVPENHKLEGLCLAFHPDFLQGYPLAKKIEEYSFFSYAVNEALFLSDKEEELITSMVKNIGNEIQHPIDAFTQDVIVSQIEVLLNYAQRFYTRQFHTRKPAHNNLLIEVEDILSSYFNNDQQLAVSGPPTVVYLAEHLNKSPKYLSDVLRNLTGLNAQQHIQDHVLKKAKVLLTTSDLSVSEIAYRLGFDFPQSFNKLFKRKTTQSPLEFRQAFN